MAFPGTYNFSYYRGDTYEFIIQPKNSLGGNFDLSGYTAEFNVATARGGALATTAAYASGGASGASTVVIATANSSIAVGQRVTGTGIDTNTAVTAISGTTITLSKVTTAQVSGTLSFYNQYTCSASVNSTTDIVTCTIAPSVGRSFIGGTAYVYDVQITDGTKIFTILNGTITVTNDITGAS